MSDETDIANRTFLQNVENLSPQIIRRVAKEMAELAAQPPEGIRVILNEADITDIQAVIEGPCKIDRSFLAFCAFSLLDYRPAAVDKFPERSILLSTIT